MKALVALLPVFLLVEALQADGDPLQSEAQMTATRKVSIVQLIAAPEECQGARIEVRGVFCDDAHGYRLFLSRDSIMAWDEPSSVLLVPRPNPLHIDAEWDGKWVMLEGVFHFDRKTGEKWISDILYVQLRDRIDPPTSDALRIDKNRAKAAQPGATDNPGDAQ